MARARGDLRNRSFAQGFESVWGSSIQAFIEVKLGYKSQVQLQIRELDVQETEAQFLWRLLHCKKD